MADARAGLFSRGFVLQPNEHMTMDPLYICVALSPLAIYLLLIGVINLRSRPLVVSGFRDALALGFGISGLALAGPLGLLLPEPAVFRYGPLAWGLLLVLYALVLALVVLMQRPRLVVYNFTLEELRPVLAGVLQQLDPRSRWVGDSALLPELGIQLHLDRFVWMRNLQLLATGGAQDLVGWKRLESALAAALAESRTHRNPRALSMILLALLLVFVVVINLIRDHQAIAQSLREVLWM